MPLCIGPIHIFNGLDLPVLCTNLSGQTSRITGLVPGARWAVTLCPPIQ
jgi:hypothetical protein